MNNLKNKINIDIFADGADLETIKNFSKNSLIKGFTTNPSLMRSSGIIDYKKFAMEVLSYEKKKPISFEVFADDERNMEKQAREISSWGGNVFVKIPITNTKGISTKKLISKLNNDKIKCNITAIFLDSQVKEILPLLNNSTEVILSVFAGRIADAGVDPVGIIKTINKLCIKKKNISILWASVREVYNIVQAQDVGCKIITITDNILKKIDLIGKDLNLFSIETVKMFYEDAKKSGYKIL